MKLFLLATLLIVCSVCYESSEEDCKWCEWVVDIIDKLLDSPEGKTVKEIEKILDDICDLLKDESKKQCKLIVSYLPEIIQIIETQSPEMICEMFKLCPAKEDVCNMCILLSTVVETQIKENKTEQEIIKALELACVELGKISKEFEKGCDLFIQVGIPEMIEELEKLYPPQEVCNKFGYCTSELADFFRFKREE